MGGLRAGGSSGKKNRLQERLAAHKSKMNLGIGMGAGNEEDRLANIQNKGIQLRTKFDNYQEHSF